MKKLLRWSVLGALGLALAGGCFHLVENMRGRRAWEAWQRQRGPLPGWKELQPPAVPDDQNFAQAPLIREAISPDASALPFHGLLKVPDGPKGMGAWREGKPEDRAAWAAAFHTPDLKTALAPMEGVLDELSEASRRPACVWPARYDRQEPNALPGFRVALRALRLRALARLDADRNAEALEDILATLRIAAHLRAEPQLFPYLVRLRALEGILQPVWEGLSGHRWNETQLARLQQALDGNPLASFRRALEGERLAAQERLLALAQAPARARGAAAFPGDGEPSALRALAGAAVLPKGWVLSALVELDHRYLKVFLLTIDPAARRVDARRAEAEEARYLRECSLCAHLFAPGGFELLRELKRATRTQASLDLARLAATLERHRLAKGALPASLEELAASQGMKLPLDPVTGQPLRYRPQPGGAYLLYATGWDGRDEGGKTYRNPQNPARHDLDRGDWPWQGK